MKEINVVHIGCRYFPYIGGSTLRLNKLIEGVTALSDINISVITTDGYSPNRENYLKPDIINKVKVFRVESFYKQIRKIKKIIDTQEIDIIHAHNPRIALLLLLIGIKKPIVIEFHVLDKMNFVKHRLVSWVLRKVKKVIVLSDVGKEKIQEIYPVDQEKVVVIKNGIDINMFSQLSYPEKKGKDIVVGYIGTMYDWQGVYTIINSVPLVIAKNDNIRFLLVGNGPEFDNIKKLVKDYKIEKYVQLTGTVNPDEVPKYMNEIDIYVMPRPSTQSTETVTPLKIYEAMSAKKAIIISKVGGLLEVLQPNEDCIAVEPGDVNDLANAIAKLSINEKLREQIAERACHKVQKVQNWKDSSGILVKLYRRIANKEKL